MEKPKQGMSITVSKNTIADLCNGKHEAFDSVFLAYYDKIRYFINGIIRSEDDAEELTQDIFVKIWTNREAIDKERSFNAYMYTLARNTAYNYLKHKKIEGSYLNQVPSDMLSENPESNLYAREIQLLINMTVSAMPQQRAKIYTMSRVEGISNDEIANRLNISKKTVENQLSLALSQLRKVISLFILFFLGNQPPV